MIRLAHRQPSHWNDSTLAPSTRRFKNVDGNYRAEYATDNNSGKIDKVASSLTQHAIDRCNGIGWTPAMEDAVLTGRATRINTLGEVVPAIHHRAVHQSHGNYYDPNRAVKSAPTRIRIAEPTQAECDEADKWAMNH